MPTTMTARDLLSQKRDTLRQALAQNLANAQGCLSALGVIEQMIWDLPPDPPPSDPPAPEPPA